MNAPTFRQRALRVLAVLFLVGIWLDGTGTNVDTKILPRPLVFFMQVSALFPLAAHATIDYRADAFVCGKNVWRELDTRAYFPMDPDNKENRFDRVMHFERHNGKTMTALDDYLVESHNTKAHDDGISPDDRIGGVELMSLRIPIPPVGGTLERWTRHPLSDYPRDERHDFYRTPATKISERCGAHYAR